MKEFKRLLEELEQKGFRTEHRMGHKYVVRIFPPKTAPNQQFYLAHPGEKAIGPIERWARRVTA